MTNSPSAQPSGFRRRWWFANASGLIAAHLVYGIVSHGFTGPHGDQLTRAQYLAHTVGLVAAALIVFICQRIALRTWVVVSDRRILAGTLVFVLAFWLGAETIGPPADWLFGFTVLGTATWIGLPAPGGRRVLWSAATVGAFWAGIAVSVGVMFICVRSGIVNPDSEGLLDHILFWVILGGVTGVAGGYVSGWPLRRLLTAPNTKASSP